MNKQIVYLLADVLHCANSRPLHIKQREFYALKDRLLERYGTSDGFDLQHVIQECWDCEGTGKLYMEALHLGQETRIYAGKCHRCNNGVYRQFWVRLERYRMGRHLFHRPRERYYNDPGLTLQHPVIEGYVRHREYRGHLPLEAAFWLFLVFEPKQFWGMFGHIGPHRARTPFCFLSNLFFWAGPTVRTAMWRMKDALNRWRGIEDDDIPF